MEYSLETIEKLNNDFGSPLYVFCEKEFIENYRKLEMAFRRIYGKYQIAYSFKTNYTPYVAATVKRLGGYAEVVSGMEYYIAKKIGFADDKIIFNGPNKGNDGIEAFLNGAMIQVDHMAEAKSLVLAAMTQPEKVFEVAIRVNADVGQSFISRFGVDPDQLSSVIAELNQASNIVVTGLHCHISRCRGLKEWKLRAEKMLALADAYFTTAPKYIDLGSGMFGSMAPEFAAQFDSVPSYEEYANAVASIFADHYRNYPKEERPFLITEPGTTLINRFVDFIGRVDAIKEIRHKTFAVLNCSEHNLGETCTLKELPMQIVPVGKQKYYENVDFTGYTCLEQDVMRKNMNCELAIGDFVVFGNVGGYSNVLKPPFIWPNCAMVAIDEGGDIKVIKKKENYDDVLHTYVF
ncbi:MAG: hypothetical protein MR936_02205 [Eubacterium sp.]|nr:hypothetical protein [Eubacterium sp.]